MENNPIQWYKMLYWQPSVPGNFLICSRATDTSYLASDSSCFTLLVGITDPQVDLSSLYPNNVDINVTSEFDMQLFNLSFTVDVIKPTRSAYIRVFSNESNQQVFSLDSYLLNTTQLTSSTNMSFEIPVGLFTPGGYYILIDLGIAMYAQLCNPLTYPVDNSLVWRFTIIQDYSSTDYLFQDNTTVNYSTSQITSETLSSSIVNSTTIQYSIIANTNNSINSNRSTSISDSTRTNAVSSYSNLYSTMLMITNSSNVTTSTATTSTTASSLTSTTASSPTSTTASSPTSTVTVDLCNEKSLILVTFLISLPGAFVHFVLIVVFFKII